MVECACKCINRRICNRVSVRSSHLESAGAQFWERMGKGVFERDGS
jgi:hypothetical protein